jgi:hypothetical protein
MSDGGSSKLREQRVEIESAEPPSWPRLLPDSGFYPRFH